MDEVRLTATQRPGTSEPDRDADPRQLRLHIADPQLAEVEDVRGGVVLRRTEVDGVERRIGDGGRTVAGEPMELLLWTSGRRGVARVSVT